MQASKLMVTVLCDNGGRPTTAPTMATTTQGDGTRRVECGNVDATHRGQRHSERDDDAPPIDTQGGQRHSERAAEKARDVTTPPSLNTSRSAKVSRCHVTTRTLW